MSEVVSLHPVTESVARKAAASLDLWLRKAGSHYQLVAIAMPPGWDHFGPGHVMRDNLTLDGVMKFCAGLRG